VRGDRATQDPLGSVLTVRKSKRREKKEKHAGAGSERECCPAFGLSGTDKTLAATRGLGKEDQKKKKKKLETILPLKTLEKRPDVPDGVDFKRERKAWPGESRAKMEGGKELTQSL